MQVPSTRLSAFQKTQQLSQHFWSRWMKEVISEMEVRQKWKTYRKTKGDPNGINQGR